jgi:hypothetical protein
MATAFLLHSVIVVSNNELLVQCLAMQCAIVPFYAAMSRKNNRLGSGGGAHGKRMTFIVLPEPCSKNCCSIRRQGFQPLFLARFLLHKVAGDVTKHSKVFRAVSHLPLELHQTLNEQSFSCSNVREPIRHKKPGIFFKTGNSNASNLLPSFCLFNCRKSAGETARHEAEPLTAPACSRNK